MGFLYHILFYKGSGVFVNTWWEYFKNKKNEWTQGNSVFWIQQDTCTYEHIALVVSSRRSLQDQAI